MKAIPGLPDASPKLLRAGIAIGARELLTSWDLGGLSPTPLDGTCWGWSMALDRDDPTAGIRDMLAASVHIPGEGCPSESLGHATAITSVSRERMYFNFSGEGQRRQVQTNLVILPQHLAYHPDTLDRLEFYAAHDRYSAPENEDGATLNSTKSVEWRTPLRTPEEVVTALDGIYHFLVGDIGIEEGYEQFIRLPAVNAGYDLQDL